MPITLDRIFEIYGIPILVYRDNWEEGFKFLITNVAKKNNQFYVVGRLFIGGNKMPGLRELNCVECKYRARPPTKEELEE